MQKSPIKSGFFGGDIFCYPLMAEPAGFEPTGDGVKVRCLTAWLYPHYGKWILSCKPYRFV